MNDAFVKTLYYLLYLAIGCVLMSAGARAMPVEELESAVKAANPGEADHLTVQLEESGKHKILKVGRRLVVNPLRHVIQIQSVDLRYVEKLPSVDVIGNQKQPWVKLRCKGGKEQVYVLENVYLEDVLIELESKEEARPVLVIPCDPYEIEKLTAVLTKFLADL